MIPLRWIEREPPLSPVAGLARGTARATWIAALRTRLQLGWSGVGNASLIVVIGEDLPWVDGVDWLGRDPRAPGLYLPTLLRPDLPLDLVARAALRAVGRAPVVLLPDLLVPLEAARPLHVDHLDAR